MAYVTDRVWTNAAVTCWVYNPMEQDVTFKLISHNPATNKTLLWDSVENTQIQIAKAGAWTNIVFPLYFWRIVCYTDEKIRLRFPGTDGKLLTGKEVYPCITRT